MNILDRTEFYPIQMIYGVGFYSEGGLIVELLPRQTLTIQELESMDTQYPYVEAFSSTFDRIYVIGVWLIHKTPELPVNAEEVLIVQQSDEIRENYLAWLKEVNSE